MAKTIKFNLICDDKPVRTIEDLQENFSIEDILEYYHNKLLLRWLDVRGYKKEYEEVSAITDKEPIEIIKKLIKIFQVESDEKKVAESIYMLEYQEEKKQLNAIYDKGVRQTKAIIDDYETGYRQHVNEIIEHPEDVARIKASIADMVKNYDYLLYLDRRELFYQLLGNSELAVMCFLMNEKLRKYYLPISITAENGAASLDTDKDDDKKAMYLRICQMISKADFVAKLGENLRSFSGKTDGYWKDLEPKGKKYMIISMASGNYVRSAGLNGGDLGYNDVHNQFVILNGIDYKSNSITDKLLYMEV